MNITKLGTGIMSIFGYAQKLVVIFLPTKLTFNESCMTESANVINLIVPKQGSIKIGHMHSHEHAVITCWISTKSSP